MCGDPIDTNRHCVFVFVLHPSKSNQFCCVQCYADDMAGMTEGVCQGGAAAASHATARACDDDDDDDDEDIAAMRRAFERGSLFASSDESEGEDEDDESARGGSIHTTARTRPRVHADLAAEGTGAANNGREFVFGDQTVTW